MPNTGTSSLDRFGVITTSYPVNEHDYAGGFVAAHVQTLLNAGHSVDVIAAGDSHQAAAMSEERTAGQARIVRVASKRLFAQSGAPDVLELQPGASWPAAAWFSSRLTVAVGKRWRTWDAVIAHWLVPCGVVAIGSTGPLLCIAHGGDIHLLCRTRLMTAVIAGLAARRARLQFVSAQGLRQVLAATHSASLRRYLEGSSIVCAMGLNTARFNKVATQRSRRVNSASNSRREVLIVARLVAIKGIDTAIDCLAHIAEPIQLTIAGYGPLKAVLEARASRLLQQHPRHKIWFVGPVSPMQRDQLLTRCDLVLVPSRVLGNGRCEGTPQIALEAIASGVAVVVTDTGGLADLPNAIRKVASDRPVLLANAVMETLNAPPDPVELQTLAADYDWTAIAAKMMKHWMQAR